MAAQCRAVSAQYPEVSGSICLSQILPNMLKFNGKTAADGDEWTVQRFPIRQTNAEEQTPYMVLRSANKCQISSTFNGVTVQGAWEECTAACTLVLRAQYPPPFNPWQKVSALDPQGDIG